MVELKKLVNCPTTEWVVSNSVPLLESALIVVGNNWLPTEFAFSASFLLQPYRISSWSRPPGPGGPSQVPASVTDAARAKDRFGRYLTLVDERVAAGAPDGFDLLVRRRLGERLELLADYAYLAPRPARVGPAVASAPAAPGRCPLRLPRAHLLRRNPPGQHVDGDLGGAGGVDARGLP